MRRSGGRCRPGGWRCRLAWLPGLWVGLWRWGRGINLLRWRVPGLPAGGWLPGEQGGQCDGLGGADDAYDQADAGGRLLGVVFVVLEGYQVLLGLAAVGIHEGGRAHDEGLLVGPEVAQGGGVAALLDDG